ncbi:hypothetical protein [Bacteroides sp. 519]|uniref:DUF7003 family protein n=1 Tax=Bacteroides sp. 519 TaxID=2302937 RepID=UPI0013D0BB87|nr:hypothetical protein [Bacteroides sp. 519]NDV58959.1 hypothetical protein [Bacteroides sp. 519]
MKWIILSIFLTFNSKCNMSYTTDDVLNELDSIFIASVNSLNLNKKKYDYTFFLNLEHGYSFNAASKIHLYGDSRNWAVVFETFTYQNRGGYFATELVYIGNCITPIIETFAEESTTSNMKVVIMVESSELERISVENSETVDPNAEYILVNGVKVSLKNSDVQGYEDLICYIHAMNPSLTWTTENEIRTQLPLDIPKLMEINQFHYISNYDSILPSKQELYKLISEILVQGKPSLWNPVQKPNNDSNNWESGFL